jgi:hypothetical protein
MVGDWPIDIWNARETWAVTQGLVRYTGIASLTHTTVLNWDAILMNWRTRLFVHRENYIESIRSRILDIVLEENPNPLGMAVRVFRHLCLKDARQITVAAAEYLAHCAEKYSFEHVRAAEIGSYGNTVVDANIYRFFQEIGASGGGTNIHIRYRVASDLLSKELSLAAGSG